MTPSADFLQTIWPIAGCVHAAACAANVGAAVWAWRRRFRDWAAVWIAVAAAFGGLATAAFCGKPVGFSEPIKEAIDGGLGPTSLTVSVLAAIFLFYWGREFFTRPAVAWLAFNGAAAFFGLALLDPHFASNVGRPDNVPIVAMIFILGFFVWLGAYQAVENDRRIAAGKPPEEAEHGESVLVWPDVVYLELIGLVLGSAVLIVWAMLIRAPLEAPANPALTPNPAKAPWYFVGLQEMLVYFPPWLAGVVFPTLAIVGLMAVPYLDPNREGSGSYRVRGRGFAWLAFHFGFLGLWILLILVGTFLRGPNWTFLGIFGHSTVTAEPNRSLADLCGSAAVGPIFLAIYYLLLPWILSKTLMRELRHRMGGWRFALLIFFLLTMLLLPLKMLLHWTLGVGFFVYMPEHGILL